ncbi:MAG: hypothetical protein ACRCWF_09135 [Beijerinckiaceae bacterium]
MTQTKFMKITLHLARTKDFPEGSMRHGYEFTAPLDHEGHIDPGTWHKKKNDCIVHRFWGDEKTRHGLLVHRAGGNKGATWGFDYDARTHSDDEAGFRFGDHVFAPGEYVSIRDSDGELETYKIVAVRPA